MTDFASLGFKADTSDLRKAQRDLKGVAQAGGTAEKSITKMASAKAVARRSIIAMGAAATGAAAGLALMTKRSMTSIDEQAKLARQLDGTIGGLAGLNRAAADAGVGLGNMTSAAQMLNSRIGEAMRNNTSQAAQAFDRLGVSVRDLASMDIDERMATLADAMQDLPTATVADELRQMGIRQRDVVLLMQQGGGAIREATREMDAYGLALSEVDAAMVEDANDAMDRIGIATQVATQQLAIAMAPVLQIIAGYINDAAREGDGFQESIEGTVEYGVRGFAFVADSIEGVRRTFSVAGSAIAIGAMQIQTSVLGIAIAVTEGPIKALNALIETANKIPHVNIGQASAFGITEELKDNVESLNAAIKIGMEDIHDQLMEPMPSTGIIQAFEDGRIASREAAEQVVADRKAEKIAINEVGDVAGDANEELQGFAESVKDSVDPMRELQRQATMIKAALEAGLLDPDEARAYMKELTDGAEVAERNFDAMADRVGSAIHRAIENQSWQDLARSIGNILAAEIGSQVSDAVAKSMAAQGSSAMGSALGGALAGGVAGGVAGLAAGSLFGGRTRTITTQIQMSIEDMVGSAFEHVKIRSSGMFGSSTRRYARALGDTTTGIMERSFGQAARQIEMQAQGMSIATQSLEDFAFSLRREGLTVAEFTEEAATAYVQASFAAVTDYQYAHENIMETWNRIARDARDIGDAFQRVTGETVSSRYADQLSAATDAITQAQNERLAQDQERLAFLRGASGRELADEGIGKRIKVADDDVYFQSKSTQMFFDATVNQLEEDIEDAKARIDQAYKQAGIEFNDAITTGLVSMIEGLDPDDAGAMFAQTADAWIEATQGTEALALLYQEQTVRHANQMFEKVGASMQYSAGQSLDEFEGYFADHIQKAIDAAAPEDMAAAAGKAEAEVIAMKDAILQADQAASRYADELERVSNAMVNDAMRALNEQVDAEKQLANERLNSIRATLQEQERASSEQLRGLEQFRSTIERTMQALRIESAGLDIQRRQQARGQIQSAIASGAVPTDGSLDAALAEVSRPSMHLFGSMEEYLAETAETAHEVLALQDLTDESITIEQMTLDSIKTQIRNAEAAHDREVKRLDSIVEGYQQQIDAMRGVDNSINSVEDAVKAVEEAIRADKAGSSGSTPGSASGGSSSSGVGDDFIFTSRDQAIADWARSDPGVDVDVRDDGSLMVDFSSLVTGSGTAGASVGTFGRDSWSDWWDMSASGALLSDRAVKEVPAFANGGMHAGGLRLVGERGPEIEATGPARYFDANQTRNMMGGGNEDLIREMRELKAMMRQDTDNTDRMQRIMQKWDVQGTPESRGEFV